MLFRRPMTFPARRTNAMSSVTLERSRRLLRRRRRSRWLKTPDRVVEHSPVEDVRGGCEFARNTDVDVFALGVDTAVRPPFVDIDDAQPKSTTHFKPLLRTTTPSAVALAFSVASGRTSVSMMQSTIEISASTSTTTDRTVSPTNYSLHRRRPLGWWRPSSHADVPSDQTVPCDALDVDADAFADGVVLFQNCFQPALFCRFLVQGYRNSLLKPIKTISRAYLRIFPNKVSDGQRPLFRVCTLLEGAT